MSETIPQNLENDNKLDVRVDPDGSRRGVCNLVTLAPFSLANPESSAERDTIHQNRWLHPTSYEAAIAIDLAIQHLNERNGSIIPDIGILNETCNIDFVGEYIDTEGNAQTASQKLYRRLDGGRVENDHHNDHITSLEEPHYNPCAVIGATSSNSESAQTSIIAKLLGGYPVISGMSTGTTVGNDAYPRFARVIPSNAGPAKALVRYVHQVLEYDFLVVLHTDDPHSNDYVSKILQELEDSFETEETPFLVKEIFVRRDGSNIDQALDKLEQLRITTVLAVFEGSGTFKTNNLYDLVMEKAHRKGMTGRGDHVWLFPESLLDRSWYFSKLLREEIEAQETPLFHAYRGAGILGTGSRSTDLLAKLVDGMKQRVETDPERLQSLLPNPLHDTASNATRDLWEDASFWSNIDARIQFLYEATALVGISACKASTPELELSGENFYQTLIRTNFTGISGLVALDHATGSRLTSSTEYSIRNIRALDDFRIELVHTDTITNEGLIRTVEPFVYNDGTTTKPQAVWWTMIETDLAGPFVITFCSLLCLISLGASIISAAWTYRNRNTRIIRASQPLFLYLICVGTALVGLTIVPLLVLASMELSEIQFVVFCNLTIWFLLLGFSILISSFYAKLHRINKIMHHAQHFKRVKVEARDAIYPVIIHVSLIVLILAIKTAITPHERTPTPIAFDRFGRPTKVYQSSDFWSEWSYPYMIPLFAINLAMFLMTVYEAWKARNLSTEFQENESILRSLIVIFLAASVGLPVHFLSNKDIEVRTFVLVALLTVLCLSIQGFLFGNKYLYRRRRIRENRISDVNASSYYSGEKLLSNKCRRSLASDNQALRQRVSKLEKEVDQLRAHNSQGNNGSQDVTRHVTEQDGSDDTDRD